MQPVPRLRVLSAAAVCAAVVLPGSAPAARADAPLVVLTSFGSCGSAPGQMQSLWGIAAGPDGSLYVADELSQRVTRFDNAGSFIGQWAVPNAFDVAIAPDATL